MRSKQRSWRSAPLGHHSRPTSPAPTSTATTTSATLFSKRTRLWLAVEPMLLLAAKCLASAIIDVWQKHRERHADDCHDDKEVKNEPPRKAASRACWTGLRRLIRILVHAIPV